MSGGWLRELDRRALPPLARVLLRVRGGPVRSRLLAGTGLLCVLAVMSGSLWVIDRQRAAVLTVPAVEVGVRPGQSLPDYVAASQRRLATLLADPTRSSQEVYGLVAFAAYLAPDRLTAVVGGVTSVLVAMRVPLADMDTAPVQVPAYRIPADVTAAMDRIAERRTAQAADAQKRAAATGTGTVADRQSRQRYRNEAVTASAEATAYRQYCSCVYAVVVQATPVALDEIAQRREVRVVDPTDARGLARVRFNPPLPDQPGGIVAPRAGLDPLISATPTPRPVRSAARSGAGAPGGGGAPPTPSPTTTCTANPRRTSCRW